MAALRLSTQSTRSRRKNLWFERTMAAIALLNLSLVGLDYSYIPLRDFYLQQFPDLTDWYGRQFKGIEPHRTTESYLTTINELEQLVRQQGEQALSSPAANQLLNELQNRSAAIVDEDPFEIANKSGTLERIKLRIRDQVETRTGQDFESSKDAFEVFWSQSYLSRNGFSEQMAFFNSRVRPLFETNYYRGIGLDGRPLDEFIKIDIWFIGLFAAEFLARTWYLSRRFKGTSWFDTMLWRWYDVFLLLPFWRWLRVIPVIARINQSNLINLEPLRNRLTRLIIANFAIEITEIVVIRVIEQIQNLIRNGDITRSLLNPEIGPRYIDLNNIDEASAITQRLSSTLVYQVLPKVRPDIEAVLGHSVKQTLQSLPVVSGIQRVPGLHDLPDQLTKPLVSELYQVVYSTLTNTLEDKAGAELSQRLLQNIGNAFRSEIQNNRSVEEIESLVTILLDEIKINYVKRIAEEDVEKLREQTQQLYEMTQSQG